SSQCASMARVRIKKVSFKEERNPNLNTNDLISALPDDILYTLLTYCDRHSLRMLHQTSQRMRLFSLDEINRVPRRCSELRLIHTDDQQAFLLQRKEKNDLTFCYSLDINKVDFEILLSHRRKMMMNEQKYSTRGRLTREFEVLRASPNAQKILKKSSVVPFTDQFIRRLREVLQLNSFHVLRCVNMIIDPLFFSG
ncbi:hypothetical protein PMAYCL1PPCAC_33118, partial [Pristionchus mayeri]